METRRSNSKIHAVANKAVRPNLQASEPHVTGSLMQALKQATKGTYASKLQTGAHICRSMQTNYVFRPQITPSVIVLSGKKILPF